MFWVLLIKQNAKIWFRNKTVSLGIFPVQETGWTCRVRLNEHKKAYKKSDLDSQLVIHSHEINLLPDFDNVQRLASC